jgi:hypothetical protein
VLPDPKKEKAPQAGRPETVSFEHRKQNRSVSIETQVCFFALQPIVVTVVLLAMAGARQ